VGKDSRGTDSALLARRALARIVRDPVPRHVDVGPRVTGSGRGIIDFALADQNADLW
jgi:hypothetical protein